jgi:hypothetical protein
VENTQLQNPPDIPADDSAPVGDKISQDLQVALPGKDLPLFIRIIAFFTLGGGLSIIGSLFAEDILRPSSEDIGFYIVRIIVGAIALIIGYGIVKKERWAIWLYGALTLYAAFSNPIFAFMPGMVVFYLYTQRKFFRPSILDLYLSVGIEKIKILLHRNTPPQI